MPIYVFQCEKQQCGETKEEILFSMPGHIYITCPKCGGKMYPVMSAPGLIKIH